MVDVSVIEQRIDRAITSTIPVSAPLGGIDPTDYGQVMEFAKTMATAKHGIPAWLRGSAGDCLMICSRAMRWRMDPYFVAEKSYLMINPRNNESRVGWESQLVHAVIETLAPIKNRLRHRFEGEGDDTVCIVWATFKGEDEAHTFKSEPLGKRIKDIGKSDKGNFRGSPLWLTKPRVQLFYDASRDWARINCPDVLAGVYTRDELIEHEAVDVPLKEITSSPSTSDLQQRLKLAREAQVRPVDRGLDVEHVGREAAARSKIIEGDLNSEITKEEAKDGGPTDDGNHVEGRGADAGDGERRADDAVTGDSAGGGPDESGRANARSQAAKVKGQGEIFPADDKDRSKDKGKR